MRLMAFAGTALVCMGSLLSACSSSPAPYDVPDGVSITDGQLFLPANKGDPAKVRFTLANARDIGVPVLDVKVAGAKSAMLSDGNGQEILAAVVGNGKTEAFDVEAFDLDGSLAPGDTTEVTLTLADPTGPPPNELTAHFPAKVLAADEAP